MRVLYKAKRVLTCAGCASVLLFIAYFRPTSIRYLEGLIPMNRCHLAPGEKLKLGNSIDASLDLCLRDNTTKTSPTSVQTATVPTRTQPADSLVCACHQKRQGLLLQHVWQRLHLRDLPYEAHV
ncbi:uncharacterized protein ACWYII_040420 isoform 1-T1 [Salvelinus alpinus]